jgi:cyclopropane-fatty-acyl-phospholipid synthase
MPGSRTQVAAAIRRIAAELEAVGASLTVESPGQPRVPIGRRPDAARVVFKSPRALAALHRRSHLGLAEAYLRGEIDLEGDLLEVMRVTEVIRPDPTAWERMAFATSLLFRDRRRWNRESIAFHYDRPPEFFLPWLDRWRSYSHGFYASPADSVTDAQERKLRFAIDALGLKPGDGVFDMGCGWGSFLEYAGRQGIRVHGITISREQHLFVEALIKRERLPCRVERIDLLDFRPTERFAGAVFMGTFEHFPAYPRAARFLARHLAPTGRLYADFCSTRGSQRSGAFLARHIWPGTATYVSVPRLLRALEREGFGIHVLHDDTASYALTVGDWADAFDRASGELVTRFGESPVRAFRLFLRASQYFLQRGRTQAHHLVAAREPASLRA